MAYEPDVITATAGIFSGRPNPQIELSGSDASALAERMRAAREPSHPPPQPKLGFYYGFQVNAPTKLARDYGIPESFNVFAGVITDGGSRGQRHWQDTGGVETFLLMTAYERGHGELLDRVKAPRPQGQQKS